LEDSCTWLHSILIFTLYKVSQFISNPYSDHIWMLLLHYFGNSSILDKVSSSKLIQIPNYMDMCMWKGALVMIAESPLLASAFS